jgi:hypothetical protein
MRKEHRFYEQRQKWLVDNNYFVQNQKWLVRNPLTGCSTPIVKQKIVQHDRISTQKLAMRVQLYYIWHA